MFIVKSWFIKNRWQISIKCAEVGYVAKFFWLGLWDVAALILKTNMSSSPSTFLLYNFHMGVQSTQKDNKFTHIKSRLQFCQLIPFLSKITCWAYITITFGTLLTAAKFDLLISTMRNPNASLLIKLLRRIQVMPWKWIMWV